DVHAREARSFLDAGCGTGAMLQSLRQRRPEARVVGLDLSPFALERSRRRAAPHLVRGSIDELPIRSATFDVVTSHDVLYFEGIDDHEALCEFARVLVVDGTLILNLPAFDWLRGAHDDFVSGRRRYTREAIEALLSAAGFDVLFVSYWNAVLFPA